MEDNMNANTTLLSQIDRFEKSKKYKEIIREYPDLEKKRESFVNEYTIDRISVLSVDEYIKFTKEFLDGLKKLGRPLDIPKYGIWKEKGRIKFTRDGDKKKDLETALIDLKTKIKDLLSNVTNNNIDIIKNIEIPICVKGKILSTYYPEKFLSVFSDDDLNHFLEKLGIDYKENEDEIIKRKKLLDYKSDSAKLKLYTNHMYMRFLYFTFGKPGKPPYVNEDIPLTGIEGNEIYTKHKIIERDPDFIKKAKTLYKLQKPGYECQICGYSFEKNWGCDYIEAHHVNFVSEKKGIRKTTYEDLWFVCSNCHTAIHRLGKLESIDDYKNKRNE